MAGIVLRRAQARVDDRWALAQQLLAAFCTFLVALRLNLGGSLFAADPLAWVLIPLWVPVLRRYRGARSLVGMFVLACLSTYLLAQFASANHHLNAKLNGQVMKMMLSAGTSLGLLLWAREHLEARWMYVCFALGLLVAGPDNHKLYAANPWKFVFSIPMTILVVGWFASEKRPRLTLGLLAAFGAICTVSDARSNFAVLLLTIVLIAWRLVPAVRDRRSTVLGTLGTIVLVAVAAYYAVQAAILDGVLGEATAERSAAQLQASGSLLLGARPELGASMALVRYRPWGFGSGITLTSRDLAVAKSGMSGFHYDPNNGYVERFMFGRGIELHSVIFDVWAWCGVVGLLLMLLVVWQILYLLGHTLNTQPVSGAVVVFVALLTLWNLPFGPWLSSMPIMLLVLGMGLVRRPDPEVHTYAAPRRRALVQTS